MPRLSFKDYVKQHQALRAAWRENARYLAALLPAEQIALHDFYEPSLDLSEPELRELRKRVTTADPSLPHRAGKAFARVRPVIDGTDTKMEVPSYIYKRGTKKATNGKITLLSEVNAHIDPAQITRILLDAAMEEMRQQRLKAKQDESDQDAA